MKVLFVTEYPPEKGAVSDYMHHLAEQLVIQKQDLEIDILNESGEKPENQIENVNVAGKIPEKARDWKKLNLNQYDLLHFQYYITGLKEFAKYKLKGGHTPKLLITLHDAPTELKHKILLLVFRNLVFLNKSTKQEFLESHRFTTKILRHKFYDVPYLGIDPKLPEIVEDKNIETDLDPDKLNIVCPGFIHEKKGFHKVPGIMPEILEKYPDAQLTFAGGKHRYGDQEYFNKVKKSIEESGAADKIQITGVLDTEYHVYQYMKEADVVLLPFDHISQSASLTKAIAMNATCITSDLPTLRPVIEEYGGILIENDSSEAMIQAVEQAVENPPEIKSQEIRKKLSWKNNAEEHLQIYEELLG